MKTTLFWLSCVIVGLTGSDPKLVDYYVNLITQEIERTKTYVTPHNSYEYKPKSGHFQDYGTYDYIIIGAGTTGSVVANRLSENVLDTVLVLEAGEDESDFSKIPALFPYLTKSKYNWNYYTTPQTTACLGMKNRQCYYIRGKGLGGTSAINGALYVRGCKQNFDEWALQGNPGWSYKDVLPYFKKSENFTTRKSYRGVGGYLNIEYIDPIHALGKEFYKANQDLGRKLIDVNAAEQLGIGRLQLTKRNGQRMSAGSAFLIPFVHRKNLIILRNSFVVKLLISNDKKAYGVIFVKGGTLYVVKCRKEVILSAGVFNSPQLLMLSGIGPRSQLEQLGIPVIEDLPVGDNLEEHVGYFGLTFLTNYTEPYRSLEQNVKDYLNNYGSLIKILNSDALVFTQRSTSKVKGKPDIEFGFIGPINPGSNDNDIFNYNEETTKIIEKDSNLAKSFQINVLLMHPKSKGYVRLTSACPFEYPAINPHMLSDPNGEDLETLYDGIQQAIEVATSPTFKKYSVKFKDNTVPECSRYKYLSKPYWYCQLKQLGTSCFHATSTCRMGPNSSVAVVDSKLRVYGIKNLRIADTSVFPSMVNGHPMATAIMVGEKVSDMIKICSNRNWNRF